MDWFPLVNSARIALLSTAAVFFLGTAAAWYAAKAPPFLKGALDCALTLPMVLPPTVVGFFLLQAAGPYGPLGARLLRAFGFRLIMTWQAAVLATACVTFPLMYRTARGAFEAFDRALIYSAQTLGRSNTWIFWRVVMPGCKSGLLAGIVLSFARALGEYGATSMVSGYIPGRTATISTAVYQLWREGRDAAAYRWAAVNIGISCAVLAAVNLFEKRRGEARRAGS